MTGLSATGRRFRILRGMEGLPELGVLMLAVAGGS